MMSSKATASKTVAARNSKNSPANSKVTTDRASEVVSEASPTEVVLFDNSSTVVEVTVKAKGLKRTSTMVSSSPTSQKAVNEKRKSSTSEEQHQNWGRILREQNRQAMKQRLQHFSLRNQPSKLSKQSTESREAKRDVVSQKHQRHDHNHGNRQLDEVPVKQTSHKKEEHLRSAPRSVLPSSASIASSTENRVVEKAVQCGGIFEYTDDRFGVFNPVRTLGFLMKELEDLVKGDKASKILSDMEQVLFRIPTDSGKLTSTDLEAISLRIKLEASTAQLEEMSKKMNLVCQSLRDERDSLQRQVHKQSVVLEEARQKQSDLEVTIKKLKHELNEAMKVIENREKTISELKETNKSNEFSQKIIADLKADLNEQTELARQRNVEMQYLILEKDKLSVLSSYKDSLLLELRNAVKELQNHIAEQLTGLREAFSHEESLNPQVSVVQGGLACSSPTSSSPHSNIPTSFQDMSDISVSTGDRNSYGDSDLRKLALQKDNELFTDKGEDTENRKLFKESKVKDSAHLEFISLPGESSHTNLPSSQGCKESSQTGARGKEESTLCLNKKSTNTCQTADTEVMETRHPNSSPEKPHKKRTRARNVSRTGKSLDSDKKQNSEIKILKSNLANDPICSNIKEQFQNLFEDIRLQSRIPVNVPSPPRNYPHPDWSDSSLPSISGTSELNVVQSNDT